MFQDISPHIFNNQYVPCDPKEGDIGIFVQNGTVLCKVEEGTLSMPVLDRQSLKSASRYLFSIDDIKFFRLSDKDSFPDFSMRTYHELFSLSPDWLVFGALTALRLTTWYEENQFCGRCGCKLEPSEKEHMLFCPQCGNQIYPRISPAIIVAVRDGEKLLLTKYAHGYSHYALVAGFAESGETIEETVKREVLEETGIHVKNITYFGSQPWPHSGSLLLGFYCDLDGDNSITLQKSELSVGTWVDRTSLPLQQNTLSLTSTLMESFRNGTI